MNEQETCYYCGEVLSDDSEMFCSQECSFNYWAENPDCDVDTEGEEEYYDHVDDRQALSAFHGD